MHLMMTTLGIEASTSNIVLGLVSLGIGIVVAVIAQRLLVSQTLARAKSQAAQDLSRAEAEASTIVEKAEIDAEKQKMARLKEAEVELEGQRKDLRHQERDLSKREDGVERKLDTLGSKEKELARTSTTLLKREDRIGEREGELDEILEKQKTALLHVAEMTVEEAEAEVLDRVEKDCRHDAAIVARKVIEDAEAQSKEKACEITLMAIQRYASEHTSESTVRVVDIPSEDMKGRIIGREGRNIRAIERATGVDIIVDDTPGVIVVSCFDKVRQTVAAESLQKLIADGRVHPSRIEEVVEQVRGAVNERVLKAGKDAILETKLRGVHPKIVEAMGKLHFRSSYGQNVLRHSVEVAFLSQIIAEQLGLNGTIARRCGFLHDIGKAMDHEMEGGHPKIGMDFAKTYGEKDPVLNVIGGHHADMPSTSFYTPIVMAADAVSSSRPGARRESMEKYIQRLEQLQDIALEHEGVEVAYAIQAGREVRVMVNAKSVNDDESLFIAKKIADRVSEEMTFPGEIKVTVLRETRAVEYAR